MDKSHFDDLPGSAVTDIKMLDLWLCTKIRRSKTFSKFHNGKRNLYMA